MQTFLTTALLLFYVAATSQTIEYRNDSLFVDNLFIDAKTDKSKIDSLLGTNHKTKSSKDDYRINPTTGTNVIQTTDYYYDKGLFFRRYDFDKTALTVGIRMLSGTNKKAETKTGLAKSFEGQLLILENQMNDKKKSSQLTNLKNCEVMFRSLRTSSREYLMQGEILHGKNQITIFFDEDTNEVTSIFISLNLTDD